MSGNPKFSILEQAGEEFAGAVEYVPESEDILYAKGSAVTVKDKLDSPVSYFGRYFTGADKDITVAAGRVVLIFSPIIDGEIYIDGEVYIL